jgi:hypothetical protein
MIKKVMIDTIMPEIITPRITAGMVFLFFIPKIQAPKVPVQAPVIGKGMATNNVTPR